MAVLDQGDSFLNSVLGEEGYSVIKRRDRSRSIQALIIPRAVWFWLDQIDSFSGYIPGTDVEAYISHDLQWECTLKNDMGAIHSKSPDKHQVVSLIAFWITGGHLPEIESIPKSVLTKLNKTLDLMVAMVFSGESAPLNRAVEPPVFVKNQSMPELSIYDDERHAFCKKCSKPIFLNGVFTGCHCVSAEGVRSEVGPISTRLVFGKGWNMSRLTNLLAVLGR